MEYAEITYRQDYVELLPGRRVYQTVAVDWVGPKTLPVRLVHDHDYILPWPLQEVGFDEMSCATLYIRTDVGRPWLTLFYKTKFYIASLRIRERFILTLMIWGMAKVESGKIPTWSDVTLVKRLRTLSRK